MRQILNNLPLHYPCRFSYQELQNFLGNETAGFLDKLKFLEEDSPAKSVFCPSCQNEHEAVVISKKEAFLVCTDEDTGRIPIDPQTLKRWQFNLPKFLELAAKELKIKGDVKNVVANDLWLIGTLQKDSRRFLIFYSRTNDLNLYKTFFDAFKSPVRAFVVFTNTETLSINLERAEAVVVPIADIVELKKNSLTWDAKTFHEKIITALRQVAFYPNNGDLVVLGKTLGTITPSSPEYFFTLALWESFNQPVSHNDIFSYCKERLGKQQDYTDTAQAFCNKIKSNIKGLIKNDAVNRIFVSTKTPNGLNAYKMTNPR